VAINRSRDVRDHIGFLTTWAYESHRKKRFPHWSKDEILSEAYVQSHRLLTTVYDPSKSTVVTFLKGFLWGAVHYSYWTSQGYRFTDSGPRLKLHVTDDTLCEDVPVLEVWELMELPEFTEEEWTIIRLRTDGYTMIRIAAVLGLKSPQSVYNRLVKIRDKLNRSEQDATGNPASTPTDRPSP
jgi:hypothetical protein